MTNAQSFPLCRLPSVACDCVVKQMGQREKYLLTTLSKRAREAVRVALLRQVHTLYIELYRECCVIGLTNDRSTRDKLDLVIIPTGSKMTLEGDDPALWTTDLKGTLATEMESMQEVFKCSGVVIISHGHNNAFDILKHVVPVIRRLKLKILKVEVQQSVVDNNFFRYVMETFRDADTMVNYLQTTADYDWKEIEPFNFRRCTIIAPITMEHLTRLFMNCRFIDVGYSCRQLTPASLNGLIRKWMEGCCALEYANFRLNRLPALRSIMDGIESEPVRQGYVLDWVQEFPVGDAFKIRQSSGVEAVVCVYMNGYFLLTTKFENPKSDLWTDDEDDEDGSIDEAEFYDRV